MRIAILALSVTLLAGAAQAGDWNGFYVGAQTGRVSANSAVEGSSSTYGVHGGYGFEYGGLVLGGELELTRMRLVQGNGTEILSNVGRLKLRAGREFGSTMAYAVAGGVSGNTPTGNESGTVYGLGVLTTVGDNLTLSGEALRQVFGNFANSGSDLRTDSFSMRVSFHF